MRLCGISSRFQLLSPCIRQVTHALLTRPPLSLPKCKHSGIFVRLACVKHAASVHPEPGSNSHVKSFFPPELIWQLIRNNVLIYCFKVASLIEAFLNYSQNLSRFFTVQLSRFFVLSLSATTSILYQMFDRLSTTFLIYFLAFIAIRIDFCRASRVSLVIISCAFPYVNNKFHFFQRN